MFVSMTQKAVCHRKPRLLGVELLRLHAPYFINLFNKLATLNYLILILQIRTQHDLWQQPCDICSLAQ